MALDDVTCIPADRTNTKTNDVIDANVAGLKVEQIYENGEVNSEDMNLKLEPTVQPVVASQIAVVDMPVELMPCPNVLVQKGEDSLMLSSKDESFWQSSSSSQIQVGISLMLTLFFIVF